MPMIASRTPSKEGTSVCIDDKDDQDKTVSSVTSGLVGAELFTGRMYPSIEEEKAEEGLLGDRDTSAGTEKEISSGVVDLNATQKVVEGNTPCKPCRAHQQNAKPEDDAVMQVLRLAASASSSDDQGVKMLTRSTADNGDGACNKRPLLPPDDRSESGTVSLPHETLNVAHQSSTASTPGAFRQFPSGQVASSETLSVDQSSVTSISIPLDPEEGGLVEATPVAQMETPQGHAVMASLSEEALKKERRRTIWVLLLISILAVVVGVTATLVVLSQKRKDRVPSHSGSTSPPTPTLTSASPRETQSKLLLESLPAPTQHIIQNDLNGTAPQSKAYQWIRQDPMLLAYAAQTNRLLQRFAAASFYFSTGGDNNQWATTGGGTSAVIFRNSSLSAQIDHHMNPPNQAGPPPKKYANVTSEQWLSYGTDECDWFSKTSMMGEQFQPCNANGTWIHLDLKDNQLTGVLPHQELALWSNLETLVLQGNQLRGTIGPEIGSLQQLWNLELSGNQFSGTIPSQAGLLTGLRALAMMKNDLSGSLPTEILKLSNLELLKMDRNRLQGTLPTDMGYHWPNLKMIMMSNNLLGGPLPTSLGQLSSNLLVFKAYGNQLTGTIPTELGRSTALRKLEVHNNQLSGALPSQLGLLKELIFLHINGNADLQGSLPVELVRLAGVNGSLQFLGLEGTSITGTIPDTLCNLTHLSFDCSDLLCGCNNCPCR